MDAASETSAEEPRTGVASFVGNTLRGGVIGAVEIVPGVSGGTMALVLGVYETIIDSAGELVRGAVALVGGWFGRATHTPARTHFSRVKWSVLIPLGIGMLAAIVLVSATLAPLFEDYPVQTRALFAGLITASIVVPARMVGTWRLPQYLVAVVAAVAAFWLTGLTGVERVDPPLWMVAAAASLAVCALVLPGVSGSFLLLVLGMYAPTLAAVNDRDLAYLGAFVIGAVVGLSLFVTGLQYLLKHWHAVTLAAMTGLMIGSLRALWPWQDEGELHAPGDHIGAAVALFLVGIAAVVALLLVERATQRRRAAAAEASAE